MKKLTTQWVAMKNPTEEEFESWCISPKVFFLKNGFIPSCHADIDIDGLEEIMDHTYSVKARRNGKNCLKKAGFEILKDPIWYFDKRFKKG
jgi:hypothetical protein